MNTRDGIRLRMVTGTLAVLERYEGSWAERLPAFRQAANDLRELYARIVEEQERCTPRVGDATAEKRERRKQLVERATHILNALEVLADDAGDHALRAAIHVPRGLLWNAACGELLAYCARLNEAAKGHAAALAPYLLDAERLPDLERAMAEYAEVVEAPRALVTARKERNAELRRLVDASVRLLTHRLDKLVTLFRSEAPEFLEAYLRARVIGPVHIPVTEEP